MDNTTQPQHCSWVGHEKTAIKIILGQRFKSYKNALNILDITTLEERRVEKFKVFKAHTERLKKLAIIHMQNKLNED